MARKSSPRAAKKPLSIWDKPLKAEFKGLFKALSEAVAAGIAYDWVKMSARALEVLSFVGFEKDPRSLAWLLVRRAMTQAIYDLVAESKDLLLGKSDRVQAGLVDRLDRALDESEFRLDDRLFDRPTGLPLVDAVRAPLTEWLRANELDESQARALSARLPTYFVYALYEEWRKNAAIYAPIKEALDNKFTMAEEREQSWLTYSAWLQRQVDERMFDEAFGLSQVYVPLRANFDKTANDTGARPEFDRPTIPGGRVERVAVDLKGAIDAWREAADPGDAIRIISGGLGSGKSSSARIYAAPASVRREGRPRRGRGRLRPRIARDEGHVVAKTSRIK